jgi:hypothetical protein
MEPDFEKIKKLASEYASTLGYFPGSCAAQNAAGYYCVVDGYIQGYLKAFEDTLSVLDDLFMDESEISVDDWFRDSKNLFQGREEFIKRMGE